MEVMAPNVQLHSKPPLYLGLVYSEISVWTEVVIIIGGDRLMTQRHSESNKLFILIIPRVGREHSYLLYAYSRRPCNSRELFSIETQTKDRQNH